MGYTPGLHIANTEGVASTLTISCEDLVSLVESAVERALASQEHNPPKDQGE